MLISGSSLLDWVRRAAATVMAVGAGRWYRVIRGHGVQVEQPRRGRAEPAAGPAAPTSASASPGAPSPDRLPPQQRPASPRQPASASVTPAVVRAWAHAHGLPVADRGPVPRWVMDQYLAQGGRPASARRPPSSTSSAA